MSYAIEIIKISLVTLATSIASHLSGVSGDEAVLLAADTDGNQPSDESRSG